MFRGPMFVVRHVRDLDQTRSLYADVMGFQMENEYPGFLHFENSGGASFALGPEEAGEQTEIWWYVDDVDTAYDYLVSKGTEIVSPPKTEWFGRAMTIKDPAGTNLYIMQLPPES